MQSILDDLYFCNHSNCENYQSSDEYWKYYQEMCDIYDKIKDLLPEDEKHLLDDLYEAYGGCEAEQALTGYKFGFKLGLRIAIESLT